MTQLLTPPTIRMRRRRYHPVVRDLIRETHLTLDDVILPIFVKAKLDQKQPISSMPGHFQLSLNDLKQEVTEIAAMGIKSVMLFGIPEHKDAVGSDAFSDHGIMQQAIRLIKDTAPELLVMSDICCCEYTDHGHCGAVDDHTGALDVNNDKTLALLQKQVISHAEAGADVMAPSGMMDGMIAAIRTALDSQGFSHLPILSYAVKYASNMYGPFRQAAEGAPQFGDRRTYQMDPANGNEALAEATLDVAEGADMLMVKPAHTYLDVLYRVKQMHPDLPLGAYHPSGEFAMIKAAAEKGWLDEQAAAIEVLTSIKRAGADFILTYFAKSLSQWLNND